MKNFRNFIEAYAWHQLPKYEIHDDPDPHEIKKMVSSDPFQAARFVLHPQTKKAHVAGAQNSLHTDIMNRSGFNGPQKQSAVRGYIDKHDIKGKLSKYSFTSVNDDDIPEPLPGPLKPNPFYHKLRKAGFQDTNPHRRDESVDHNIVIAFARMNPFTAGHQKLIEKVKSLSRLLNCNHEVIITHPHDHIKNPLTLDEKLYFARKFFPEVRFRGATKESPAILNHLDRLREEGYKHITLVVGSDRLESFQKLFDHYEMDDVSVISAGQRNSNEPSASDLREAARRGNYEVFKMGVPSRLKERDIEELYLATRKGLNLINNT